MALKLDYVSRETLTNLKRNFVLTTASMLTVAVSLSMVGLAFFFRYGVGNATQQWRNGVQFEVFLNLDATPDQKSGLERELSRNPNVEKFTFVGREQQYELFSRYYRKQPQVLQNVHADDLPESYRVVPKTEDAGVIGTMADSAKKLAGVNKVAFPGDQVRRVIRTSRAMQYAALTIAGVLLLASSVHIFNTIRMAIFARRREIEVMKLVGASNWFIRVPFMVEGLIQGVIGALAAVFTVYFLKAPLSNWILDNLEQFRGFYIEQGEVLFAAVLLTLGGAAIGAVSAGVAVTRFLDV
jgi:cell division transport system permease protein